MITTLVFSLVLLQPLPARATPGASAAASSPANCAAFARPKGLKAGVPDPLLTKDERDLRKAVEKKPSDVARHLELAACYDLAWRFSEAAQTLATALDALRQAQGTNGTAAAWLPAEPVAAGLALSESGEWIERARERYETRRYAEADEAIGRALAVLRQNAARSAADTAGARTFVPPRNTSPVPPRYPAIAKAAHMTGTSVLGLIIDAHGTIVRTVVLVSAGQLLDQSALEAARQWRFEPAQAAGRPVAIAVAVPVGFGTF